MNWTLTPLEQDIFKEIANIGLSKAADALAIISKEKVLLHVPEITLVTPEKLISTILTGKEEDALLIRSDIVGELKGKTVLIFSDRHTCEFIEDSLAPLLETKDEIGHLKSSFLLEISNIVTGSVLTQLSNIFGLQIHGSVPEGPDADPVKAVNEILNEFPSFQPLIFTVKTKFLNTGRKLELPLVIIFDTDTMLKLVMLLRSRDVLNENILKA